MRKTRQLTALPRSLFEIEQRMLLFFAALFTEWVVRSRMQTGHIIATLRQTNWVVGGPNGAATRLGPKRTTLIAKMRNLGISKETANPDARPAAGYGNRPASNLALPTSV